MASGVECHFLTGYPRQFVRVGEERWVHPSDVVGDHYPAPGKTDGTMAARIGTTQALIQDVQDLDWVVDGVSFMKATIAHLEQRRQETAIQGGRFTNDQGKHTYVKFKWEGEDLLIDNTNVCHCGNKTPVLTIYTKLALKMGWLRKIEQWI